jgi:chromate reductase, NAD(P)H dehydrogenase (quinone)
MEDAIKILGICGSLRRQSCNMSALRAATELLPQGATLEIFDIAGIPGFNQDPAKNHRHASSS